MKPRRTLPSACQAFDAHAMLSWRFRTGATIWPDEDYRSTLARTIGMIMQRQPKVVLVGVDQSNTSELALREALALASQGADVHCAYVVDTAPVAPGGVADDHIQAHAESRAEVSSFLDKHNTSEQPIELHVLSGNADEQLCALAEKLEADLLIVGTHGLKGFSRLWVGSCAESVVRKAPCAVLVVRPKLTAPSRPPG